MGKSIYACQTCRAGVSLASLSPTSDADAVSDEELPRLERGAGRPVWCFSSDRHTWKSLTKLARDDLYIGLIACQRGRFGAEVTLLKIPSEHLFLQLVRINGAEYYANAETPVYNLPLAELCEAPQVVRTLKTNVDASAP